MAAAYVFGAATTSTLILVACLAAGFGVLVSLAFCYLGALVAISLIVLVQLRATGQHSSDAEYDEVGLAASSGPSA